LSSATTITIIKRKHHIFMIIAMVMTAMKAEGILMDTTAGVGQAPMAVS